MSAQELYNSRVVDVYCKLIAARYPEVDLEELAQRSGICLPEISDHGHWFTQDQVNAFYANAVVMTGNDQIAREAGRFAVSAHALGHVRQYILSAFGPRRMFQLIQNLTPKLTRSTHYECTPLSENSVNIIVTPLQGVKEEPFQCENRMGFFEAGVMLFNYSIPNIRHARCLFRGDDVCDYEVSWGEPLSSHWRKLRNCSVWGGALLSVPAVVMLPASVLGVFLPVLFGWLAVLNFLVDRSEKAELSDILVQTSEVTEKLVDQVNVTYSHALAVKEIGSVLKHDATIDAIMQDVCETLNRRLDFERGGILLADQQNTRLNFINGFGYSSQERALLNGISFSLDNPDSTGVLTICFRENRSILINDLKGYYPQLSERSRNIASQLGVRSLICCPICYEGRPIGVLMMDNPRSQRPLLQTDLSLIEGVAPAIGTGLHNVKLLKEKGEQFDALLKVMSASIDARDSLTRGHSEKVTEYAQEICHVMGIDRDYSEAVRVAALLHDYGKLGVPDSILKKPGKLTSGEYEQIKTHAEKTGMILRQIRFEEALSNVPLIAEAHHEKLDGSGYPLGLKGDEIPLGARIIAVADIFEALTAKRHYRESLDIEVALEIIRREVDTHYDADVFCALEVAVKKKIVGF